MNDRKSLGYECQIDTQSGNRLVLITDSSVVFVKNVTLNGKRKIFVIIVVMILFFSDVKSAGAIGTNLPPQQRVVSIMPNRDANRLMKPRWIKEFVSGIRGGDNEKLIKSIISKVSEADWDIPSINKILKKPQKLFYQWLQMKNY